MALSSIWNRIGIHALLSSNTYLECLLIDTYPYSDYSESCYLSSTKPESSSTLSLSLYYGERDESRRQHYRCETIWKMLYYNTLYICSDKWVRKRLANRQSDTTESVVRVCLPPFTHTHTHTNARALIPAQKSGPFAIVLVMHKQKEEKVEQELVVGCPARSGGIQSELWNVDKTFYCTQRYAHTHKSWIAQGTTTAIATLLNVTTWPE